MTDTPVSPRKPMQLLIDREWLKQRIETEPDDGEIGAGYPMDTPEDAARLLEMMKAISSAQSQA